MPYKVLPSLNVDVIKSHVIRQVAGTLHVSEAEMRLSLFKLMLRRQLLCHFMFHFLVGCPQPFAWPCPQPRWRSSATCWSGVRTNAGFLAKTSLVSWMEGLRTFLGISVGVHVGCLSPIISAISSSYYAYSPSSVTKWLQHQCCKGSCWGCLSSIFRIHIILPGLSC